MTEPTRTDRSPRWGLVVGTALACVVLTACVASAPPRAEVAAGAAERALAQGHESRAIREAELAVAADPSNAAWRMLLGNAYLAAGRFASAETSFADAMALGENSPRAALSLALSLIAQGRYPAASALLDAWQNQIAVADLGLAYALAGQPERGIHLLANAIRAGENNATIRQNLAFAYAMAGRWREARLMAQQDVPASEVNDRIATWAELVSATAYQQRVAHLLGVPAGRPDPGQPLHLARTASPAIEQAAAPASAPAMAPAEPAPAMAQPLLPAPPPSLAVVELPPSSAAAASASTIAAPEASPGAMLPPAPAADAFAATSSNGPRVVSNPVVQPIPQRNGARPGADRPVPSAAAARAAATITGTHLVQLGSFASEEGARRAWGIFVQRYPDLAGREMVITQAIVNGRNFWRVSAGGFTLADSRAMCNRVRARSADGCISWAAASPLPGAIDSGVRLARR